MEAGAELQGDAQNEEETQKESLQPEPEIEQEEYIIAEEATEQRQEQAKQRNSRWNNQGEDRSSFIHGLAVGLGVGCIATFVIIWISVFFTPQLPYPVTYENLLSVFVYPLIYLLAVGLIALTAGIVREYYSAKSKF